MCDVVCINADQTTPRMGNALVVWPVQLPAVLCAEADNRTYIQQRYETKIVKKVSGEVSAQRRWCRGCAGMQNDC